MNLTKYIVIFFLAIFAGILILRVSLPLYEKVFHEHEKRLFNIMRPNIEDLCKHYYDYGYKDGLQNKQDTAFPLNPEY